VTIHGKYPGPVSGGPEEGKSSSMFLAYYEWKNKRN
jgi:hypothetical protein